MGIFRRTASANSGLSGRDIFGLLSILDLGAQLFQLFGEVRLFAVRAGNGKSFFQKYFGKAAHTDAADAYKMNVDRFLKINLIHDKLSPLI